MADPIDAADITDDDILWRRIDPGMIDQGPAGVESIQSWAFKDQSKEISVYLARETTQLAVLAAGKPGQILLGITARSIRALGFKVVRDPDPDNAAHCLVLPYPNKPMLKALAVASRRIEAD